MRLPPHFADAPAERLALLRIAVGAFTFAYLLGRFPIYARGARLPGASFAPVGPVSLLETPLPAPTAIALVVSTIVLAVLVAVGAHTRVTAPLLAVLLLWCTSYRSSFGMVFHSENVLVWHVIVLGASPAAADVLSWDGRRKAREPARGWRYGLPLLVAAAALVTCYLVAGIAKLRWSGLEWATGHAMVNHVAYNAVRKAELGGGTSWVTGFVLGHPWMFRPLAWLTLLLELGAPLALLHRRAGWLWAAALWSVHVGIAVVMQISFIYPLSGVAFLPFFPLERSLPWLGALRRKLV